MSGYDNVHNDSPYDQGYLDALCMLNQFNAWNEQENSIDNISKVRYNRDNNN